MKIEKVSANIRYSKAQEDGAWKTVELAAEGTVEPLESWQTAQAVLYAQLGQQMKALWGNGRHAASESTTAASEEIIVDNAKGYFLKPRAAAVVAAEALPEPLPAPPPTLEPVAAEPAADGVRGLHPPEPAHWCNLHQVEYRRHENGKGAWYSHKTDTGWCRER